jgi:hypothetical protein
MQSEIKVKKKKKVKLLLYFTNYTVCNEDVWESGGTAPTTAIDIGEWSASCPGHLPPGKGHNHILFCY